ncbi:MAG: 50S ribosomal protein L31e [archaeon]
MAEDIEKKSVEVKETPPKNTQEASEKKSETLAKKVEKAIEKILIIPLRKAYLSPGNKKSRSAIKIIREFAKKHTKRQNIKISRKINEMVWERGGSKPPTKIKVLAKIYEDRTELEPVVK